MKLAQQPVLAARPGPLMIIMVIMLCVPGLLHANQQITQTFELRTGWNTVFPEVTPTEANPDVIFEGVPITQAITYYPQNSPVQFIQDPDEAPWDKHGWSRWVPKSNREAFLKNLFTIQANQPYLLYCTKAHALQITGTPEVKKFAWQPDAFNFVGFHVDKTTPPTFAQFFEGSAAHSAFHIYQLMSNKWQRVEYPAATNILSGQVYWVWCDGGSEYQGPMEITLPGTGDGLDFLAAVDELEIEVTNHSPNPLSFTLAPVSGRGSVPLSLKRSDVTAETVVSYERFVSYSPEVSLESGETHGVTLGVRRKDMAGSEVTGVLKIIDDIGNAYYIKVSAGKI